MLHKTGLNIGFFEASAIVGLKVGYSDEVLDIDSVKTAIKNVCDRIDYVFSGTITSTTVLVAGKNKDYEEESVLIWTSIYPRYPVEKENFKNDFMNFIGELLSELKQDRTAINFTDESIMVETEYCKNPDLK